MQKRPYIRTALFVSIAAIILSILCFIADYRAVVQQISLFSRSGALLALSGAILEYQLGIGAHLRNAYTPGSPITMLQLAEAFNLSDKERHLRGFAHSMVALGTVIWGYGDLIFKYL
ncbi:MAG: hypothetical protein ACYCZH_09420 [Sulfuriferula sp.]